MDCVGAEEGDLAESKLFELWEVFSSRLRGLQIQAVFGPQSIRSPKCQSTLRTRCQEFVRNPYNVIDLAAFIPTIVRLASGVETPSTARNPFSHYVLVCFVPVIRQLKLIRRFQKLQLLLHLGRLYRDPLEALASQLAVPSILFADCAAKLRGTCLLRFSMP